MDSCLVDDCHKKEWQRLRSLRLQQVRAQSNKVAQEARRRAKETREKRKNVLKIHREEVLNEWKKMTIEELEQKYNEEMEKVGLARKVAEEEPESEKILEERKIINDHIAMKRGKLAEQKHLEMLRDAREKENAPIRRKEMTRDIEDIRAGLIVQCRDWRVINQAGRQVVLDVPVTNVDDFKPREPTTATAKPTTATNNPPASPKRAGFKSPKSPRTPKILPYPSPKRSPLVPRLIGNFGDSSSRDRSTRLTSAELPSQEPLVQFYDHQARYSRTYRLGSRLVERADPLLSESYGSPKTRTLHRRPIPVSCVPTSTQSAASDDEDLNSLLRRYVPSSVLSQGQENYSPSVSPAEFSGRRFERAEFTPPSRENDVTARKNSSRNTKKPISQRNRKNSRKQAELLKASDKALKEGWQLWEELSKNSSKITSDSECDGEAVVKFVVNVHCGQSQEQEPERVKIVKSDDKSCQVEEEKIKTHNTGTEIGESLIERSPDESESKDQVVKKRMRRKKCLCVCKKYGCCCHCAREPLQRTSTLADLPRGQQQQPQVFGDVSSIYQETPKRDKSYETSRQDESFEISHRREKSFETSPRRESIEASSSRDKPSEVLEQETPLESDGEHLSEKTQSGWSSTAYLSPPIQGEERTEFKVNPALDYYIRTLLGLRPDPCDSSECTECRQSAATESPPSTYRDGPTPRRRNLQGGEDQANGSQSIIEERKEGQVKRPDQSQTKSIENMRDLNRLIATGDQSRRNLASKQEKSQAITAKLSVDQTGKMEGAFFQPIKFVASGVDSQNNSEYYEAETALRLKRIAELKDLVEQIRKDQEKILFSSSNSSPNSDSSSHRGFTASEENGGKSVEKKRQTEATKTKPPPALEDQLRRLNLPDTEPAHRLSTIMEVDSRLYKSVASDDTEKSDSSSSSLNILEELLRRNVISSPFRWSEGASLSNLESSDSDEEQGNVSLRAVPGQSNVGIQDIFSLQSSYNPSDTLIEGDWQALNPFNPSPNQPETIYQPQESTPDWGQSGINSITMASHEVSNDRQADLERMLDKLLMLPK